MKKKVLFVILVILIALLVLVSGKKEELFISDTSKIKIYTDEDLKKVENVAKKLPKAKALSQLNGVSLKYEQIDSSELDYCKRKDLSLVSKENGFDVVVSESGSNFEADYKFYKSKSNKCNLIAQMDNISDLNAPNGAQTIYANESIYNIAQSTSDANVDGMVRVQGKKVERMDTLDKKYTNPVEFKKGVLMIESGRNVVAFDKNNEKMFSQSNEKNGRRVLVTNIIDKGLFMIVKKGNIFELEAYEFNNVKSIEQAKPKLSYDISKHVIANKFDFSIKKGEGYGSFTNDPYSPSGLTIIFSDDFSELYLLNKADTVLGMEKDIAYLKIDELFYVVDLKTHEKEHLGKIQSSSYRIEGKDLLLKIPDLNDPSAMKSFNVKFTMR